MLRRTTPLDGPSQTQSVGIIYREFPTLEHGLARLNQWGTHEPCTKAPQEHREVYFCFCSKGHEYESARYEAFCLKRWVSFIAESFVGCCTLSCAYVAPPRMMNLTECIT